MFGVSHLLDLFDFLLGEREIEDIEVIFPMFRIGGSREDDVSFLNMPS